MKQSTCSRFRFFFLLAFFALPLLGVAESEPSVRLWINGEDGSSGGVVVQDSDERLTIKWVGTGVKACKGNWSPKELAPSGEQRGRITSPLSFRLSCVSADGETASASVFVQFPETEQRPARFSSPPAEPSDASLPPSETPVPETQSSGQPVRKSTPTSRGKPYARYCPDPTQIFTGVARNSDGTPKIKLAVDPAFNEKMKRERFTADLPVAPIYDLVFAVVPNINEYCLPQYDESGTLVKKVDPPKTLPFTASIELAGKALISAASLSWNGEKDEDGQPVYEWKIKGWKNGIMSESKMERLIRAAHDNNPSPMLSVQVKLSDGRRERIDQGTGFTLCAPVWGNGAHEVVYDRVAHRLSDFIYQSDGIISGAFLKVDPFKAYQKEFAHFINLRNYQGKSWFEIHEAAQSGKLPLAADCGGSEAVHIAISPLVSRDDFASALIGGRFIQVASDMTKRVLDQHESGTSSFFVWTPFPLTVLHEFGHSFADLSDEYIRFGPLLSGTVSRKNCTSKPSADWVYNDVQYADNNIEGCFFSKGSYRPSQASIMRGAQSGETRFNVVSCGYIIAAIKKEGEGPKYWRECMNPEWNTIKPTSKAASLGNMPASLLQAFSLHENLAVVGSADANGQEILIEHISADGTFTGETISVPSISYSSPPLEEVSASGGEEDATVVHEEVTSINPTTPPESSPTLQQTEEHQAESATSKEEDAEAQTLWERIKNGLWGLTQTGDTSSEEVSPQDETISGEEPASEKPESPTGGMPVRKSTIPGRAVKVIVPDTQRPPAEFLPLERGERTAAPEQCLDASGARAFSENEQPFRESWGARARCAQTVADATALMQKANDVRTGLLVIQNFLDALTRSFGEVKNLTTLDNASFVILPAGEAQGRSYETAGNVSLRCVSGATVPVGASHADRGATYAAFTPKLRQQLDAVRQKNQTAYQAYQNEPAKNLGVVTNGTLNRLAMLKETLASNFVLLTGTAFAANPSLASRAESALTLSVTLERGTDGAPQKCAVGGWAGLKLGIGGVDGDFVRATVTLDGKAYQHDCIPESYLVKELPAGMEKNITYFTQRKKEYESQLAQAEAQLAQFASSDYDCVGLPAVPVAPTRIFERTEPKYAQAESASGTLLEKITDGVTDFINSVERKFTPSRRAEVRGGGVFPLRELTLDTQGNPVQATQEGVEREGRLSEQEGGATVQSWKIKYEKKGHARFVCDPPVLNVSFDKKDSKGNKRELFTGASTYPSRPTLQYQKIRMVPLCAAEQYYNPEARANAGFGGKVDPQLREYFTFATLRSLGLPAVDVIGFANVSFVSPDAQYNGKPFRYMLLQRDNEQDDELPFTEQFGLEPVLIEDGKYNVRVESGTSSYLGDLRYQWNAPGASGEMTVMRRDPDSVLKNLLIAAFVQDSDRGILHNEDYGKVQGTDLWKTITYGFDWNMYACFIQDYYLKVWIAELIKNLPKDQREIYTAAYYRAARELFSDRAVLQKMHAAIERFPFPDNGGKSLLHNYVDVTFYRFGSHFSSPAFADYAGVEHEPFAPLPFSSESAFERAQADFSARCGGVPPSQDTAGAKVEVSSAILKLVPGNSGEKRDIRQDDRSIDPYMQADFTVVVTAPQNQAISISKSNAFSAQLIISPKTTFDLQSSNDSGWGWGKSYERPPELAETTGPVWVVPAGKTARFAVAFRFQLPSEQSGAATPPSFEKGSVLGVREYGDYRASLTRVTLAGNAPPLTAPDNTTNAITLLPPLKLDSVFPESGVSGSDVLLQGSGFTPENNTVIFQGNDGWADGAAASPDGKMIRVKVPDLLQDGSRPLRGAVKIFVFPNNSGKHTEGLLFTITTIVGTVSNAATTTTATSSTPSLLQRVFEYFKRDSSAASSGTGQAPDEAVPVQLSTPPPVQPNEPSVTAPLTVFCSPVKTTAKTGETVTWSATAHGGGGGSYRYEWIPYNSDPVLTPSGASVRVVYSSAETKDIAVKVTAGDESITELCAPSVKVELAPPPTPSITTFPTPNTPTTPPAASSATPPPSTKFSVGTPSALGTLAPQTGTLYEGAVTLSGVVTNNGDTSSGTITPVFQHSPYGSDFSPWQNAGNSFSLAPKESSSASTAWTASPGTYYFRLCVNSICSGSVRVEIVSRSSSQQTMQTTQTTQPISPTATVPPPVTPPPTPAISVSSPGSLLAPTITTVSFTSSGISRVKIEVCVSGGDCTALASSVSVSGGQTSWSWSLTGSESYVGKTPLEKPLYLKVTDIDSGVSALTGSPFYVFFVPGSSALPPPFQFAAILQAFISLFR